MIKVHCNLQSKLQSSDFTHKGTASQKLDANSSGNCRESTGPSLLLATRELNHSSTPGWKPPSVLAHNGCKGMPEGRRSGTFFRSSTRKSASAIINNVPKTITAFSNSTGCFCLPLMSESISLLEVLLYHVFSPIHIVSKVAGKDENHSLHILFGAISLILDAYQMEARKASLRDRKDWPRASEASESTCF